MYSSTLPLTSALDGGGVVNATHRPLYPQESPGSHCVGGWLGPPRVVLDWCGKSRSPNRDSIPGPSNQERVTIPTELSRPTCLVYVAEITATNAYNFFFFGKCTKMCYCTLEC